MMDPGRDVTGYVDAKFRNSAITCRRRKSKKKKVGSAKTTDWDGQE